jgi:hypothetical protein
MPPILCRMRGVGKVRCTPPTGIGERVQGGRGFLPRGRWQKKTLGSINET